MKDIYKLSGRQRNIQFFVNAHNLINIKLNKNFKALASHTLATVLGTADPTQRLPSPRSPLLHCHRILGGPAPITR